MEKLFSILFLANSMIEQESDELMENTSANFLEGLSNRGNQK